MQELQYFTRNASGNPGKGLLNMESECKCSVISVGYFAEGCMCMHREAL